MTPAAAACARKHTRMTTRDGVREISRINPDQTRHALTRAPDLADDRAERDLASAGDCPMLQGHWTVVPGSALWWGKRDAVATQTRRGSANNADAAWGGSTAPTIAQSPCKMHCLDFAEPDRLHRDRFIRGCIFFFSQYCAHQWSRGDVSEQAYIIYQLMK